MADVTVPRQVLVVDGLSETATVLQAVLEPRGTVVQRARSSSLRPLTGSSSDPDVVILDLDQPVESDHDSSQAWSQTPQVVIGSRRIKIDDDQTRFLQKPFQFPELIRAVEDLLNRTETP